jgi:hypothetical protein
MQLTEQQTTNRETELRGLERQIVAGKVTVRRNGNKVEFVGWKTDRTGPGHWHDDCAYRTLMAEGSSALRTAMARTQTGRSTGRVTS